MQDQFTGITAARPRSKMPPCCRCRCHLLQRAACRRYISGRHTVHAHQHNIHRRLRPTNAFNAFQRQDKKTNRNQELNIIVFHQNCIFINIYFYRAVNGTIFLQCWKTVFCLCYLCFSFDNKTGDLGFCEKPCADKLRRRFSFQFVMYAQIRGLHKTVRATGRCTNKNQRISHQSIIRSFSFASVVAVAARANSYTHPMWSRMSMENQQKIKTHRAL